MLDNNLRKRRGRPRRGDPATLGYDQIVAEAVRLIDAGGLESFSLRELARARRIPGRALLALPGRQERSLGGRGGRGP